MDRNRVPRILVDGVLGCVRQFRDIAATIGETEFALGHDIVVIGDYLGDVEFQSVFPDLDERSVVSLGGRLALRGATLGGASEAVDRIGNRGGRQRWYIPGDLVDDVLGDDLHIAPAARIGFGRYRVYRQLPGSAGWWVYSRSCRPSIECARAAYSACIMSCTYWVEG
ncbi:hypothetical protein [Nocardia rhamnosiphila]|uniref:Uncharacterized protein n=1 Tax=Nocardia rhamnosiphila TaxID=426716 RepID=A0ABV2X2A9_9NOCA